VELAKAVGILDGHRTAGLAQESVGEQATAHPDLAVDPPDRELDPHLLEGLPPRENVLIDAVDQRPVEVEDEGLVAIHLVHPR
jgi:hypothetical protein